jgi:hypothetical protein
VRRVTFPSHQPWRPLSSHRGLAYASAQKLLDEGGWESGPVPPNWTEQPAAEAARGSNRPTPAAHLPSVPPMIVDFQQGSRAGCKHAANHTSDLRDDLPVMHGGGRLMPHRGRLLSSAEALQFAVARLGRLSLMRRQTTNHRLSQHPAKFPALSSPLRLRLHS